MDVTERDLRPAGETGAEPAPRKSEKRRRIAWALIGLLILGAMAAYFLSPMNEYAAARRLLGRRDYAAAAAAFRGLGGFLDSERYALESENLAAYEEAERLFREERYEESAARFGRLDDFRDARERVGEAVRLISVRSRYEEACDYYDAGDLRSAYAAFREIGDDHYKLTDDYLERIPRETYDGVFEYADLGRCAAALNAAGFLEEIGDARAEGLRERLRARERFELASYDYCETPRTHIETFDRNTTVDEYLELMKWMVLTGTQRYYLGLSGASVVGESAFNAVFDACNEADWLCDGLMPVENSVYRIEETIDWIDYSATGMSITLQLDEAGSMDEAAAHIDAIEGYCAEAVRALNDALLLGGSMTNRQKAWVIYEWVCNAIDYDEDVVIHDAYMALLGDRLGVCESYAALYVCMCRMAGIPSWGQVGRVNGDPYNTHIWAVQLDEEGGVFYTDPTWGDDGWLTGRGMTLGEFEALYRERETLIEEAAGFSRAPAADPEYLAWCHVRPDVDYFWQSALWDTHEPARGFEASDYYDGAA